MTREAGDEWRIIEGRNLADLVTDAMVWRLVNPKAHVWNVREVLEPVDGTVAVKIYYSSAPSTPSLRQELKDMVDAEMEAYGRDYKRRIESLSAAPQPDARYERQVQQVQLVETLIRWGHSSVMAVIDAKEIYKKCGLDWIGPGDE